MKRNDASRRRHDPDQLSDGFSPSSQQGIMSLRLVTILLLALLAGFALAAPPQLPAGSTLSDSKFYPPVKRSQSHAAAWQAILAIGALDLQTLCQSVEPRTTRTATSTSYSIS